MSIRLPGDQQQQKRVAAYADLIPYMRAPLRLDHFGAVILIGMRLF